MYVRLQNFEKFRFGLFTTEGTEITEKVEFERFASEIARGV